MFSFLFVYTSDMKRTSKTATSKDPFEKSYFAYSTYTLFWRV